MRSSKVVFLTFAVSLASCALVGHARAGQATFRVVAYMQLDNGPVGLIEGSPDTFYSSADGGIRGIFSVTSQGTMTYLATFSKSSDTLLSLVVSGADGRFYSSLETGVTVSGVISVGQTPGSLRMYPPNAYFYPEFSQNLPDGTLLGYNTAQLVKSNLKGDVGLLFPFPTGRPGAPVYATDRNYYGIAGDNTGSGWFYKLTPSGSYTQLYTLPGYPFNTYMMPLIQGTDGNFYGTTPLGGANGFGTIYKLTPDGQYTLLYTFPKSLAGSPGPLIEASDGRLYGGTAGNGNSLLYSITKSGEYHVVYRMTDGQCPCSLVQGSDGQIYGTALTGGPIGDGVIFALDGGLPKPQPRTLEFEPISGPVGAPVRIWGYNLLKASVSFGGVPATSVRHSGPNYVWANVPAGAISGPITVTTPGGTSTTRDSFTVE
jgi:uncharacterized repeat protein (TIGR03803 family)